MYDWANSAYMTTVAVAVLPAYFASTVVPSQGFPLFGMHIPAVSLWGYLVSAAALTVFLLAPALGAAADYTGNRKRMLMLFCAMGSFASIGLLGIGPGMVWPCMALFFLSQVGFAAGNVFYDAFLPHIAAPQDMDNVSGKGFAYGYLGGGLQFALALAMVAGHAHFGINKDTAARIAMASAGLWWGLFALVTFKGLPEPAGQPISGGACTYIRLGFSRLRGVFTRIRGLQGVLPFMLAFLFYNDGVQTVISMATIYGKTELGLSTTVLMATLLIIQFVSIGGALGFSKLAGRIGTKNALMLGVALWTAVCAYAYTITTPAQYLGLGMVVGLVMGGTQALSRSLFARLMPADRSAEFFGYYSVLSKFSAIGGPLVFGVVTQATGSARGAVLWIIAFFIIGLGLLLFVPSKNYS